MTIIGIMGKARAGKDTVGELIKKSGRAETIALADPIKTICMKIFGFSYQQCYGKLKEVPDKRYPRNCPDCGGCGLCAANMREYGYTDIPCDGPCGGTGTVFLTPRWAMQYIGTEIARALYKDVWIDYGLRRAGELKSGISIKTGHDTFICGTGELDEIPIVAITDVRFINEAKKITEAGGVVWRVVRPEVAEQLDAKSQAHASEMELESNEIDQYVTEVIDNSLDLTDLEIKVRMLLHSM